MKKIGFVDYYLSEWHANNYPAFIEKICERTGDDYCVSYAWAEKYESPVDGRNTDEWCRAFGVEKCATIDELCEKSDYIFILAPDDPEKHLEYAKAVFKYGKTTYIDKTFAPDYSTAKKIFDIADEYGTKFFTTSSLRYADEFNGLNGDNGVIAMGGGANIVDYSIHLLEMIVKLIADKPVSLKSTIQGEQIICTVNFENAKKATMVYAPAMPFAICAANDKGESVYSEIKSDFFVNLTDEILKFFNTGVLPFDPSETLHAMKIRDAIAKSIKTPDIQIEI